VTGALTWWGSLVRVQSRLPNLVADKPRNSMSYGVFHLVGCILPLLSKCLRKALDRVKTVCAGTVADTVPFDLRSSEEHRMRLPGTGAMRREPDDRLARGVGTDAAVGTLHVVALRGWAHGNKPAAWRHSGLGGVAG